MYDAADDESVSGPVGTHERPAPLLTVERAAWALVGLLAAGLRFSQLGLRPLGEGEATQALAAYRFVHGAAPIAPAGTIPALFTGNVVSLTLLGASDATVRWLPALAGVILVLLPYGLRYRLGRGGALAAGLLLAVSPSAVTFSRTVDSAILVATCGLALVVALIRVLDFGFGIPDAAHPAPASSVYLAAGAVGLGLCSGSGFLTILLITAAFCLGLYLTERWLKRPGGWSALVIAWRAIREEKGLLSKAGAVLAAVFGLVATTLVLHPAGVGNAADLIGTWARGFLPESGGQPAIYPLLLLLRYEAIIVVLGLVETGTMVLGRRTKSLKGPSISAAFPDTSSYLLVFWAFAALVVIVLSGHRPAGNILLVVVPLALLAGQGVERAWRWVSARSLWREAAVGGAAALGLAVFGYLQITAYTLTDSSSTVSFAGISLPGGYAYLALVLLALVLLIGLGAVVRLWRGREAVVAGGWLAAVVVLGLFGVNAMWQESLANKADRLEWMAAKTTASDVRAFLAEMEALSTDEAGDAHTLPVTIEAITGPVVAWYLRDFSRQVVVESLSAPPNTTAAVTLRRAGPDNAALSGQELPIGESFRGRGFPLRTYWQPWGLGWRPLIRWWLLNSGSLPVVDQEVVVWVASPANGQ